MAKKKRNSAIPNVTPANIRHTHAAKIDVDDEGTTGVTRAINKARASFSSYSAPAEVAKGDWTVLILSLMMFFAPALGVPNEEMLQDTLKSIVVSFATLMALLLFFWGQRNRRDALRWHFIVLLPVMLMLYGLGSMVWAHTYLAGVETIRWFIFVLIVWLGLNTFSRDRLIWLAWGIHWGAFVTSLWAALQFWFDFKYFPQGPNPASTFVNRNFFAEYVVCTLPFSALLLAYTKKTPGILIHSFTFAFIIVSLMMTGTRGALGSMWLELFIVLPIIIFIYRHQLAFLRWNAAQRIICIGIFFATVLGLGLVSTGNPNIPGEGRGLNAFQRALNRTQQIKIDDGSLGVRFVMWRATSRIIKARPFSGVGAGTWESDIPLYQDEGAQLETDYYVHNEILQLLAEYGIVGWIFLILLTSYLLYSAWKTWTNKSPEAQGEAPFRAIALASLLALLIVSNVGFPWRLASTGALFAVCLAILAASDFRLGYARIIIGARIAWQPAYSQAGAVVAMMCIALAAYITQQAAECERKIVKATKIALTITASGDPGNPKWDKPKAEMLTLIKEGTTINPHYRKITPMVADELAKWGDWKNAIWIWETVVSSRPYVVAIMSNIARGYASIGNNEKALEYLERSRKIQPRASTVRSLEVVLLGRSGQEKKALELAREAIDLRIYDYDLVNSAFILAWRAGDFKLAMKAMDLRIKDWPTSKALGMLQLGNMYTTAIRNQDKALEYFKAAMEATPVAERQGLLPQIPPVYWPKLGFGHITPVIPNQTSSTKK